MLYSYSNLKIAHTILTEATVEELKQPFRRFFEQNSRYNCNKCWLLMSTVAIQAFESLAIFDCSSQVKETCYISYLLSLEYHWLHQ